MSPLLLLLGAGVLFWATRGGSSSATLPFPGQPEYQPFPLTAADWAARNPRIVQAEMIAANQLAVLGYRVATDAERALAMRDFGVEYGIPMSSGANLPSGNDATAISDAIHADSETIARIVQSVEIAYREHQQVAGTFTLPTSIPYPSAAEYQPSPLPANFEMDPDVGDTEANQLVTLGYTIPSPGLTAASRSNSYAAQSTASREFATRNGIALTGDSAMHRAVVLGVDAAYRTRRRAGL